MHVKFRLTNDSKGDRITQVYFVNDDKTLELITQMRGWIGLDFEHMSQDAVEKVADTIANAKDGTKFIE